MGRKIVMNGTKLTNTAAPKLARFDRLETHGSIYLLEPMHPTLQWADGVPANATQVPNVLAEVSAPVIGSDALSDLNVNVTNQDMTDPMVGSVERSVKGGIHAMYNSLSPKNIDNTATGYSVSQFKLELTTIQRDYIMRNWYHTFYMSTWAKITRGVPTGKQINGITQLGHNTSITGNYHLFFTQNGVQVPAGQGRTSGQNWTPETNVGNRFIAGSGYNTNTTSPAKSYSNVCAYPFMVGNGGTLNSYMTAKEAAPSVVFYRGYMEDLTVSGRSYAEVEAIDRALYEKEVLTEGGRYFDDTTPSDPATLYAPAA